jgi:hypothetical protein
MGYTKKETCPSGFGKTGRAGWWRGIRIQHRCFPNRDGPAGHENLSERFACSGQGEKVCRVQKAKNLKDFELDFLWALLG